MANSYTANYELCQWAAGDPFLRTEFNADNQKIEAGLTGLDRRLSLLEAQLPDVQKHVYNLMLQNHYDGKSAAYRQRLFFDGLQNQSLVGSFTPGAYYDQTKKQVRVYSVGQKTVNTGFALNVGTAGSPNSDGNLCMWVGSSSSNYSVSSTFTPTGYCTLSSVVLRLARFYLDSNGYEYNVTAQVRILDGSTVLGTSNVVTVTSQNFQEFTLSFSQPISLAPKAYTLQVTNVNQKYYLRVSYSSANSGVIGAQYNYTALNYTSGGFTSVQTDLGANYSGALAWVRHVGGGVALALKGSGDFIPMTKLSTAESVSLLGVACTETAFRLGTPPAAPNREMTAQITLTGSSCGVCDYGIVFF